MVIPKYQQKFRILCIAPIHRAWGNRVIREAEVLNDADYSVYAIMLTDEKQEHRGVHILPAPKATSRIQRIINLPQLFYQALCLKADIYHLHNPDMTVLALLLKLSGKRVIYDTHEDYSRRLLIRDWVPYGLKKPLGVVVTFLEVFVSYVVDATFVTQAGQLKRFSKKTLLLRNAPHITEELIVKAEELACNLESKLNIFRLIYVGGVSRQRGLLTMLDALEYLNRGACVRLWLIGPMSEELVKDVQNHEGWQYVDYQGVLKHEEVFAYISRSDLGLAMLNDVGDHACARPNKLFEYMAMGKPFIASNFHAWKQFIVPRQPGWWISPDDGLALGRQIQEVMHDPDDMEVRGQEGKAVVVDFNWKKESKILLDTYNNLLCN